MPSNITTINEIKAENFKSFDDAAGICSAITHAVPHVPAAHKAWENLAELLTLKNIFSDFSILSPYAGYSGIKRKLADTSAANATAENSLLECDLNDTNINEIRQLRNALKNIQDIAMSFKDNPAKYFSSSILKSVVNFILNKLNLRDRLNVTLDGISKKISAIEKLLAWKIDVYDKKQISIDALNASISSILGTNPPEFKNDPANLLSMHSRILCAAIKHVKNDTHISQQIANSAVTITRIDNRMNEIENDIKNKMDTYSTLSHKEQSELDSSNRACKRYRGKFNEYGIAIDSSNNITMQGSIIATLGEGGNSPWEVNEPDRHSINILERRSNAPDPIIITLRASVLARLKSIMRSSELLLTDEWGTPNLQETKGYILDAMQKFEKIESPSKEDCINFASNMKQTIYIAKACNPELKSSFWSDILTCIREFINYLREGYTEVPSPRTVQTTVLALSRTNESFDKQANALASHNKLQPS